jgi:protein-S-isoprenylcysteine O-methyltransferase
MNERERCVGDMARVQAWRFFANRIPYEEALLVEFFGGEYVRYRQATPTWLPYID